MDVQQPVNLHKTFRGRPRREVNGIDAQGARWDVDNAFDCPGVHIKAIHCAEFWKHDVAKSNDRPRRQQHRPKLSAPIVNGSIFLAFAGVHIERGAVDPIEFLQMPPKDVRLVDHAASFPEPFDFLQTDNVGVAYGIGNAIEIIALVQPQP